ncbi:MAG: MG2 domain-containing protein, partial [Planctomycetia bacterium]
WTVAEIQDTAIVKRPTVKGNIYYIADATSGTPIAKANVEFFGYRFEYPNRRSRNREPRPKLLFKQFAEYTNHDGQIKVTERDMPKRHQVIAIARTGDGAVSYYGFSHVWYQDADYEREYKQTRTFVMTDRPVYRPEQPVHYKFWVRNAQYDMGNVSNFAEKKFLLEIRDPRNEKVVEKTVTSDAYGGIEGTLELPKDATLGVWRFTLKQAGAMNRHRYVGNGSFRVEEYKKPEYEVTIDAPKEPVMLGEKITATIKAKYYFGSPVTNAKVKYTVTRTAKSATWYPPCRWDWLFGPGYWWFAYDYCWYPGWNSWGCPRPEMPWWPHRSYTPPEIVMERQVEIGDDGTVKVEIDTTAAKAFFGDSDHSYAITAQVVDQSRRTIVGNGNVLVARKPFKVNAWVNRGYYTTGDTIVANFAARTVAGKGVKGDGEVTLFKVSYDKDGKPTETKVQNWDLPTKTDGTASLKMSASAPGQYRVAYKVTDSKKHEIEGGYVFTVVGRGFDGRDYRFNSLELVPDKKEYKPGEKVRLQINTDRIGSTVLLYLRPSNGIYLKPQTLRLKGKSTIVDVDVSKKDMPNFFVEAMTVADGRVHTMTREIVVPPEKRILNLEVLPSAETYKPGEKAKVTLKLTDLTGEPFVGSTVVTIYDKSVEYISGGSNIQNIKEFFWKWRRHHYGRQPETNLTRYFQTVADRYMQQLGIFGHIEVWGKDGECDGVAVPCDSSIVMERGGANYAAPMSAPEGKSLGMGGMGGMGGMKRAAADSVAGEMQMEESMSLAAATPKPSAPGVSHGGDENGGQMVQPTVRSNFADTALWVGNLETDQDGTAQVELDMPENLTTWKIRSWAMGQGTRVGEASAEVITRKDLILRLQAPRFFVQTDQVYLSAVVHNYLKTAKKVSVQLELPGTDDKPSVLKASDGTKLVQTVTIKPEGEARIDWPVDVIAEGKAVVRMKALTDEESDAVEQTFPAYVHGMLRTESYSGVLRPEDKKQEFTISVPDKRRPKLSKLEIRYSPTLAGAMVDALPYLVDYPYGCTEQTLNRFLPTVITQKVLIDNGIDLAAVREKQTNLNAQEIGDAAERAKQWKRYKRNPVFDEAKVRKMVKDGVNRLQSMQCSDGGWGWFSGWGEHSYPHTTAQVVHGLQVAKACDVALVPGTLERGVAWLTDYQNGEVAKLKNGEKKPEVDPYKKQAGNMDAFVYMVLIDAGVKNADMGNFLYRDRTKLSISALAMLGLAYEKEGDKEKLAMVLRNLSQYVVEDNENQTAYLNMPGSGRCWWCWYGSENEAEANYLKLLARTDPKGQLASRMVKYLLNNRKNATYWNSTRDTAACIEAFAEYLRKSGESKPDMTVKVSVDGKLYKTVKITAENLFSFDNQCLLEGKELTAGKHRVTIERTGTGPVYYNAYETNFTLEDFIPKAGLEVKVNRKFYRLIPEHRDVKVAGKNGRGIDQKVEKYVREELQEGATVTSGDLIEVELEIDSKNDYEYLIFEDFKAAGLEAVDVRSGYNGNDLHAYVEYRDNRVVFFVKRLARGKHSVKYRLRAEIPGRFSALPATGNAMYAPELKGNSDEMKIKVKD